jgi:hypothetical protein
MAIARAGDPWYAAASKKSGSPGDKKSVTPETFGAGA